MFLKDPCYHKISRIFIAFFHIYCTYECFKCIPHHRITELHLIILFQEYIQSEIISHSIQHTSTYDLGPHLGQKAFILVKIFFKQVFCSYGRKQSIAQKFQSFIGLSISKLLITPMNKSLLEKKQTFRCKA